MQMDRMVFFLSDTMLHRVLPASATRYCFTIWIDGAATNLPEHNRLDISKVRCWALLGISFFVHLP